MLNPWGLFLCQLAINMSYHVIKASLCLGGSDIFATVSENRPVGEFIANLSIVGDPTGVNSIRLCLTGENANWFYLEGRTIRLNSSILRVLDRERHGSVLMAALTCYEDDIIQSEYRVMVEILNENDNKPRFLEKTIQPRYISELTAVNSVVFTVKAIDADGDTVTYIIDRASPDASYFRIDLPNSGKVILDKPLDYETKTKLQLVIYAVETNTKEWYNTSASLIVNVEDGDDHYPQFLPCTPISQDHDHMVVCTNPIYVVNITEKDQDMLLNFSPGPIHAEDGDRSLDTPLLYSILSGADKNRFQIDNQTAEITMTKRVENRHMTPIFRLRIMASQLNDPKKYSVATALVRVLAENRFPPLFNRTTYKGFIIESSSPATLVSTYGNEVLFIQAIDQDFVDGVNPKMHYSLQPTRATTGLYHITEEGVIIAKTDRLRSFDRLILEVVAMDEESGEVAKASVDIELLQRSQPIPWSPFRDMDVRIAGGIMGGMLLLLVTTLFLLIRWAKRRRRRQRQKPAGRGAVALGKHLKVVNSGRPMIPLVEEVSYQNEGFSIDYEASGGSGSLFGRHGVYTRKQSLIPPPPRCHSSHPDCGSGTVTGDTLPILVTPEPLVKDLTTALISNSRKGDNTISTGAVTKDEKERNKQRDMEKEEERNKQRDMEKEEERNKQRDMEKEEERNKQRDMEKEEERNKQRDMEKEEERNKQRDMEKEEERNKQRDMEKEEERNKQRDMEKEEERNKQRDMEKEEEREWEKQWERAVGTKEKRKSEGERTDKPRDVLGASSETADVSEASEDQTNTEKPQSHRMKTHQIREPKDGHKSTSEE
ncbi:cadherin-related family member 5-like isoform X2 [Oncorhynchus keta]|uniref:cadherin-related family member 5-like isoform X2 n=1 Tax=Oncorhynchus keta TaxID=8018 RepID=UPI00227A9FAE|nr:cadherin-related family member 5-like isoform X2 [Oncorhynchus keta]